jgi:hypothetical protein
MPGHFKFNQWMSVCDVAYVGFLHSVNFVQRNAYPFYNWPICFFVQFSGVSAQGNDFEIVRAFAPNHRFLSINPNKEWRI